MMISSHAFLFTASVFIISIVDTPPFCRFSFFVASGVV